jgi:peptide/nickel transport system permease protein
MTAYIIRRIAYAVPILVGVNLITFFLFFFVYSPNDMARTILGEKRIDPKLIEEWKREHGYHLPRLFNTKERGLGFVTQTIFWHKSMPLLLMRFGTSDKDGSSIGREIRGRIAPSLSITVPMFFASLLLDVFVAMIVAFYRGTYIDFSVLIVCVVLMSISILFYIVGGQFLVAKHLRLVPISGFDTGLHSLKFIALPILIGFVAYIGGGVRYYRTLFLEEINKDYVRTARAKGLGEGSVLFKHTLKNALIPILTSVVVMIPFLIMGNLLLEAFFAVPGLGSYLIEAIHGQDFAVVRAMVFLGSVLYIIGLIMVDISYTLVDPRVRLG